MDPASTIAAVEAPVYSGEAAGLSQGEAQERLRQYGFNDPVPRRHGALILELLALLLNPLIVILLIASLISVSVGQSVDASIIFVIAMLSVTLNFIQTYRSQRAVQKLHDHVCLTATVLRDGSWQEVGRESEVRSLAEKIGIRIAYGARTPEEKVELVRAETERAGTVFVGDGINDAPAMQAATVGIAFGHENDITSEAADAVILDRSLGKVDELMHIGARMHKIALQSAVGGMVLSAAGMVLAAFGWLPPVSGAVAQELIDLAVLNAVRVTLPFGALRDY
jgi:cation transport ATPase